MAEAQVRYLACFPVLDKHVLGGQHEMWYIAEEVAVQWDYIIVPFLFDHCLSGLVGVHADGGVVPFAPVLEYILARCLSDHVCWCSSLEDSYEVLQQIGFYMRAYALDYVLYVAVCAGIVVSKHPHKERDIKVVMIKSSSVCF